MLIRVTEEVTKKSYEKLQSGGYNEWSSNCPVAVAFFEATGVKCSVSPTDGIDVEDRNHPIPISIKDWIDEFDRNTNWAGWPKGDYRPQPIEFEIDYPSTETT